MEDSAIDIPITEEDDSVESPGQVEVVLDASQVYSVELSSTDRTLLFSNTMATFLLVGVLFGTCLLLLLRR